MDSRVGSMRRIEHTPIALDLIRAWRARKLRISNQPTGGVARNVEFGDHANAAIAGVCDNLAHLFLRVVQSIGTEHVQFREALAFDAEALVVGEMPVKHIELDRGHGVEISLYDFEGHPMARDVEMQTAPGKARMVLNVNDRRFEALLTERDELPKCFETTQHSQRIRSRQTRQRLRDLQVVALVFTELLD